jgi:hypothetical protein
MSTSNYNIAVKTAGFSKNAEFRWDCQPADIETRCRSLEIADENEPGIVVCKNNDEKFDIFIVGIDRNVTEFMSRPIRMKVFVGGLTETAARGTAIGILKDWQQSAVKFAGAVTDDRSITDKEWKVDFATIKSAVEAYPAAPKADPFAERRSNTNNKETREQLFLELSKNRFSDRPGIKLYCAGSLNDPTQKPQILAEADRFYNPNAKDGVLESPKPVVTPPTKTKPNEAEPVKEPRNDDISGIKGQGETQKGVWTKLKEIVQRDGIIGLLNSDIPGTETARIFSKPKSHAEESQHQVDTYR